MSLELRAQDDGVVLKIRAVPGARREGILGLYGDALKLATAAPPERGKANRRLLALLAKTLHLPPRELELVSGETSREKRVLIRGLTVDELQTRLAPYLHP